MNLAGTFDGEILCGPDTKPCVVKNPGKSYFDPTLGLDAMATVLHLVTIALHLDFHNDDATSDEAGSVTDGVRPDAAFAVVVDFAELRRLEKGVNGHVSSLGMDTPATVVGNLDGLVDVYVAFTTEDARVRP
jgi:hypothetical protein